MRPNPRPRRDRGDAALELAILGPAVLLLTVLIVQAGLWFYARHLALAAAQAGVTAGRSYGASPETGRQRAAAFLAEQARDSLRDTTVSTAGSSAVVVRVEVTGRSLSLIPGVPGAQVRQAARTERERFVPAQAGAR